MRISAFPHRGLLLVVLAAFAIISSANPWTHVKETPATTALRDKLHQSGQVAHGNYCGFGTIDGKLETPPVDRLDAICQKHDICYIEGTHHCTCDSALREAVQQYIDDPAVDDRLRRKARLVRATFSLPVCKLFPQGVMPPRDKSLLDDVDAGNL